MKTFKYGVTKHTDVEKVKKAGFWNFIKCEYLFPVASLWSKDQCCALRCITTNVVAQASSAVHTRPNRPALDSNSAPPTLHVRPVASYYQL